MNRTEFSQMLVQARKHAGLGKNEMCRKTGFTYNQLQYLEVRPNNFAMDKAFHYLGIIGMLLSVEKGKKNIKLNDIESIVSWIKNARKDVYSQRSLAEAVGCTYQTIANIERGFNKISIDTFLKIADILGYTVKIESKWTE